MFRWTSMATKIIKDMSVMLHKITQALYNLVTYKYFLVIYQAGVELCQAQFKLGLVNPGVASYSPSTQMVRGALAKL